MYYYQPADEPATERLLMIVLEPSLYGGEHRHLRAYIVRRADREHTDPDTGRQVYGDGPNAAGYRRAEWVRYGREGKGVYVSDFALRCQMTVREHDGRPGDKRTYGSDYAYRDIHVLERKMCKLMNETFRKVDSGMERLAARYGNFNDEEFHTLCVRVADTLMIKKFVVARKGCTGTVLSRKDDFIEVAAAHVKVYTDTMIDACYPKAD
jgi:hypothetical protein